MTWRYHTFTGASFLTVHIRKLKQEKKRRAWQLAIAPLRRLMNRLTLPNSATQIAGAVAALPVLSANYV